MPSQRETLLCHYHYDALDRLIGTAPLKKTELQRFYCKSRLATEIQGQIQHSIFQQGDQLLAQQQRRGDSRDTTLLATDQQRSVLHTIKANNERYPNAYSPYGHRRAENGLTSLLGFNGERPDLVTGHYLLGNGYRAFNPVLMRFNSPDSWSPFGRGGLNAYAYCLGDPINNSDPTGHIINPFTLKAMASRWLAKIRANIFTPSSRRPKLVDFITPEKTNGILSLDVTPPKNRPVMKVKPLQASPISSLETSSPNVTSTNQGRAVTNANEPSRNLETRRRLEEVYARSAARNAALAAADASPMVTSRGPASPDTGDLSMYFGLASIGLPSFPRLNRHIRSGSAITNFATNPAGSVRHS